MRDWHKDKLDNLIKRCELAKGYGETICVDPDAVISLIERADKAKAQIETLERAWRGSKYKLFTAEAREKKLREAVEAMMPGMWDGMRAHFEVVLASLYKEEEAK